MREKIQFNFKKKDKLNRTRILEVTNDSTFNMIYLKYLSNFAFSKVYDKVVGQRYSFHFSNRTKSWSGTGWNRCQKVRLKRHFGRTKGFWPYCIKDHRYYFAKEQYVNNRTELLLFLIGHELGHAIYRDRKAFGRKASFSDIEFHCNDLAEKIVIEYRKEKDDLWEKIRRDLKKEHYKKVRKVKKKKEEKDYKKSVEYKLELAEKNLNNWLKKQKSAENKIKSYQKKIRSYKRRIEKKKI